MNVDVFSDFKIAGRIQTVYPPILLGVGLTGNMLSVVVLSQAYHRRTSTGVLLMFLAVTDSFVLINNVFVRWLEHVSEAHFRNSSTWSCKFHVFITYFLVQLSDWILVFVTTERVFSVLYPHRVRAIFSRRRAIITLVIFMVFLLGLNAHLLYGYRLIFDEYVKDVRCEVISEHENFMFKIWTWIDFGFTFAIPFCILLSGNITIIIKLKSSKNFRRRNIVNSENDRHYSESSTVSAERRTTSDFTKTAILLNVTFAILSSPFSIFAIGQPYWFTPVSMTPERHANLILIGTVLLMLLYTNNAINFVLYILCGSRFRRDFIYICRCSRRRRQNRSATMSSNRTAHSLNIISS